MSIERINCQNCGFGQYTARSSDDQSHELRISRCNDGSDEYEVTIDNNEHEKHSTWGALESRLESRYTLINMIEFNCN